VLLTDGSSIVGLSLPSPETERLKTARHGLWVVL
jgi:hypothetical protein